MATLANLGFLLHYLGRLPEVIATLEEALAINQTHDGGEGRPDSWIAKTRYHLAGERTGSASRSPLSGTGISRAACSAHECGQKPVEASPAPVDRGLGDTSMRRYPLHRRPRVPVLYEFTDDSLHNSRPGASGPAPGLRVPGACTDISTPRCHSPRERVTAATGHPY